MRSVTSKLTLEYIVFIAVVVLLAILPKIGLPASWVLYILVFLIFLAMSNMWNLVAGYTGLISLAPPAFLGLAGYTLAITSWLYIPWWAGLLGGAIIAGIFAFLISFAIFRTTGVYFAIATLVIPEALRIVFNIWRPVGGAMAGGGAGYTIKGLASITVNDIYWLALVVGIISIVTVRIILRSNLGLGMAAIRDNEKAAASSGVNTFRIKLYPFIISAVITGLAGGVFFIYQPFIEPSSTFNVQWTMIILLAAVIGGLRSEGGPIIGTVVYVFLYFLLSNYGNYSLLIQGIILVIIMLLSPQGIVGILKMARFFNPVLHFMQRPLVPARMGVKDKTSATG